MIGTPRGEPLKRRRGTEADSGARDAIRAAYPGGSPDALSGLGALIGTGDSPRGYDRRAPPRVRGPAGLTESARMGVVRGRRGARRSAPRWRRAPLSPGPNHTTRPVRRAEWLSGMNTDNRACTGPQGQTSAPPSIWSVIANRRFGEDTQSQRGLGRRSSSSRTSRSILLI